MNNPNQAGRKAILKCCQKCDSPYGLPVLWWERFTAREFWLCYPCRRDFLNLPMFEQQVLVEVWKQTPAKKTPLIYYED